MNNLLLVFLFAATFFSCSKIEEAGLSSESNLKISLKMAAISTKSAEESVHPDGGNGYVLPYTKVKSLKIELLSSDGSLLKTYVANATEIAAIQATNQSEPVQLTIHAIPGSTGQVKAYLNELLSNKVINDMQGPAGFTVSDIPYEGVSSSVTPNGNRDDIGANPDNNVYLVAAVTVKPALTRFELKGVKSDIQINRTPSDKLNASRQEALDAGFNVGALEQNALENLKKSHPNLDEGKGISYEYQITYTSHFTSIESIDGIYMNYFRMTRGVADLEKNVNDAAGGWAGTNYDAGGKHANMWDTQLATAPKVNAFNLFTQNVNIAGMTGDAEIVQAIKENMPHVILKLGVDGGKTRWLTMRAFATAEADSKFISAFNAGMMYSLALNQITINPWTKTLVVIAKGKTTDDKEVEEPSEPETKDEDPTDSNPEPDKFDIIIQLKVEEWKIQPIKPIL